MRLDHVQESGNVEDRRGYKRPALAAGGGIGTLVIIALAYFLGIDPNKAKQVADRVGGGDQAEVAGPPPDDGEKRFAEKVIGLTNAVWRDQFPANFRRPYEPPTMVLFSEEVNTGCGRAPSAVGPFYCPADKKVYVDPTFFAELERKLGGSSADFSKAYVIAHEVGHHVQNLLGYNDLLEKYRRREGENAGIRLELQADYLAGVAWHHAERKQKILERGDVDAALTSAKAIGDDRLMKRSRGWANPEKFNHGTSAQRLKYFKRGLETGDASKRTLDQFFDPDVRPLDL